MATDASTLARELAARLAVVVPDGIAVAADAGSVEVTSARASVSVDLGGLEVEHAARAVLDAVQDFVAEELTRPWPESGISLPLPAAAVEGGSLRLWYGDELRPVLELPPIPLE